MTNQKFIALVDTGSMSSLINEKLKQFQKIKIKPIQFRTITNIDVINFEVHTPSPIEINAPPGFKVRWKVRDLGERKYDFIMGRDILNQLETIMKLENKIKNKIK